MKLYNLKDHNEQVSFAQAVTQGLGKHQGLFFPHDLPEFNLTDIDDLLTQDFVTRSAKILSAFIGDEIPQADVVIDIQKSDDELTRFVTLDVNSQQLADTLQEQLHGA